MKLTFSKTYLSIEKDHFNEIEFPNLVVLTGINGSGKSHLLEAIENGSVLLDGCKDIKIVRFDYKDFFLENEAAYNARQIIEERNNAWSFFQNNLLSQIESYKNSLGDNYEKIKNISVEKDKGFLFLTKKEIGDEALFQQYDQYKKSFKAYLNKEKFKNNQQLHAIRTVANKIQCSIDDLTQDDFADYFQPYQLKKDFLPNQLGRVIWDYYLKYRNNEVNEFINEKHNKNYPVLSEVDFFKRYGDKPWEVINRILEKFNSVDYRLPSPEGSDYFGDYQVRLEHTDGKLKNIDFSALSSGEKVLMALIASIYKISTDKQFPDLLLLDEIDASLHPSMIESLLETVEEVFLSRGTKVVLVTHSPTTIALAPDLSVYVMNKRGPSRIEKKSKNDALAILTEGFATLDEGLRIFDEVSKQKISIISEGHNVKFIKMALHHRGITDVDVISGVENRSGDTQLNTIFEFLKKIPHPSKKVIIVWDPEVKNSFSSENNTHPFILFKNESNRLIKKGIENLFEESLIRESGFIITTKNGSGEIVDEHFDNIKKNQFREFILQRNNKDDFENFKSLIDKVNELR